MTYSYPGPGRSGQTRPISIEYLADRPECIPTLAHWFYEEWSSVRPGDSVEGRIALLKDRCSKGRIPLTMVAVSEGELLGSASLIEHDMDNRLELYPWLAGVFVAPARRRQGIGATLVRRIVAEADALRIIKLYLYTFKSTAFYTDLGWVLLEPAVYRGKQVSIMSYSHSPARS